MEYTIKVNELTHEDLVNIFSTALYGCGFLGAEYDREFYDALAKNEKEGDCFEDKLADVLLNGGKIKIVDYEAEGELYNCGDINSYLDKGENGVYEITLKHVLRGIENDEGWEYADELLIREEGDYYTANNLLQIIVFGEVIYG